MNRKRRNIITDLTPLLDVIFIILFLILIQSTKVSKQQVKEAKQSANDAMVELKEAREKLDVYEQLLSGSKIYYFTIENDKKRKLIISDGSVETSYEFTWDTIDECSEYLAETIEEYSSDATDSVPVFLIFKYDANTLYQADYSMINKAFTNATTNYDNIYIQMRKVESEDGKESGKTKGFEEEEK